MCREVYAVICDTLGLIVVMKMFVFARQESIRLNCDCNDMAGDEFVDNHHTHAVQLIGNLATSGKHRTSTSQHNHSLPRLSRDPVPQL